MSSGHAEFFCGGLFCLFQKKFCSVISSGGPVRTPKITALQKKPKLIIAFSGNVKKRPGDFNQHMIFSLTSSKWPQGQMIKAKGDIRLIRSS